MLNKKISVWSFIFWTISFAVAAVFFVSWPLLISPADKPLPEYPSFYSANRYSCKIMPNGDAVLKLRFSSPEPATQKTPAYSIEENLESAASTVIFSKVTESRGDFDCQSDLIFESVENYISDEKMTVAIKRRNAYVPLKVSAHGAFVNITIPAGNNGFPEIIQKSPASEEAVFPAPRQINFIAALNAPLKLAFATINDQPVVLSTQEIASSTYSFSFDLNVENDREYQVKAVIIDNANRIFIDRWRFLGQVPSQTILGKNRFDYLGWWGQVNSDGVTLRSAASKSADKVGVLSSANQVKVLKEIFGEWINGNNLWYVIDGGAHPGAYIFSDYITPISQPKPPEKFAVPESVAKNEKWIDVDITKKVLTLFDYDKPVFATYISPGRDENPTQTGTFRVWYKLQKARMKGGPPLHRYRYDLKDIPWTMYYNYDYAIHGTYWHDRFGTPQSAGCTNMTQGDAKYIFDNTLPAVPEGKQSAVARDESGRGTGTVIYNHK